jgi:glycosyltransferase involved in cell wall biosynthesis
VRILLVAPIPPDADAPMAIPSLLHAQLSGLSARNSVCVVCVAGPEPAELASVERLSAAGYDVHAVVRSPERGWPAWRRRLALAYGWVVLRRPWRTVWYADPRLQGTVDRLIAGQDFDVLVAEDDAMGVVRPGATPSVLTLHELGRARPAPARGRLRRARSLVAAIDWRRWPRYQRAVCANFTLLSVFTPADRARVAELDPSLSSRVRVTPFGVELPDLAELGPETPDTLVFAGDYTHPPNVDAAIWLADEILPRIRAERPAVRLLLAGRDAPPAVQALASVAGVEVLGAVPRLAPLLSSAACVMAPVRLGGGMRMKVLQGMAAARPVVTTPLGARGIAADGAPPLAVGRDADELAALTLGLLGDEPGRQALGQRAREFVAAHYAPESVARRLEAMYAEAVELAGDARGDRR